MAIGICLYSWPHSRRLTVNARNNWPPPRQPKLGSESRSTFNGIPDNLSLYGPHHYIFRLFPTT